MEGVSHVRVLVYALTSTQHSPIKVTHSWHRVDGHTTGGENVLIPLHGFEVEKASPGCLSDTHGHMRKPCERKEEIRMENSG